MAAVHGCGDILDWDAIWAKDRQTGLEEEQGKYCIYWR